MPFTRGPSGQLTIVVAAILFLAVSGLVWSQSRSAGPGVVAAMHAASTPAVSPMDLMLKGSEKMPVENWDVF